MGLFDRLLDLVGLERKAVEFEPELWAAINGGWGLQTKSGAQVSTSTSLQVTAFHRAQLIIAEGVAQLPCQIYKKDGDGISPAVDHDLYDLLLNQPNLLQDSFQYFRTTLMHAAGSGNGVSYRNVVNGKLRELIPIRPEMCQITIHPTLMTRQYWLSFDNGRQVRVEQEDVLHISGPMWGVDRGLDPSVIGREAIGLARTLEGTQAALHKNGVRPAGILETDQKLDKDQIKLLREQWLQQQSGEQNAGNTGVMTNGLKWKAMQQNGVDAQHLETRGFQIEEIARLMGVFAIMLGHAGNQSPTFASAESFFDAHVRYTLQPWLKAVIKAIETQLLTKAERQAGLCVRFDTSELLRGSLQGRAEYYKAAVGNNNQPGWLTRNEVRADDGWNPSDEPGMDEFWDPKTGVPSSAKPVPGAGAEPGDGAETPEDAGKPIAQPSPAETKARPRPLYIMRKLLNADAVVAWARKQGFKSIVPGSEMHVTVAWSRQPVDWMTLGDPWSQDSRGEMVVPPGGARIVEPLGTKGAVVLLFASNELTWRHESIIEKGASWEFQQFQPHVTISYDAEGVDLATITPYQGELRFGPELFSEAVEPPAR